MNQNCFLLAAILKIGALTFKLHIRNCSSATNDYKYYVNRRTTKKTSVTSTYYFWK